MPNTEEKAYLIFRAALFLTVMATIATGKESSVGAHEYYVAIKNSLTQTQLKQKIRFMVYGMLLTKHRLQVGLF